MSPTVQRPSAFSSAEEIVTSRARREPLRPALGWHDRMMLLGRFADIVAARAEAVSAAVAPGATVAQLMSDTPGQISSTFAIWRAGCTAVPLDHRLAPGEIGRRLAHSQVSAVIAHEEHLERVAAALQSAGIEARVLVSRGTKLLSDARVAAARSPRARTARVVELKPRARRAQVAARAGRGMVNDVAFHAYAPSERDELRCAVLTHANVVASALRISIARGDAPDDVALATHPSCDVAALVAEVLSRLISGGAVALLGPGGADAILSQIEQHRVTDVSLTADLIAVLADRGAPARRAIRSVRKVLIRDPGLPLTLKRELIDRFPGAELIQSYGRTETTDGILTARQGAVFRKPDTLGVPHPGLVVAVADPAGRPLRAGQTGEIVCRGAVVMRGYHRSPTLTRAVLRDGWLRTGDLGYIDTDGELSLIGPRPGQRTLDKRVQRSGADRR